MILIFDCGPFGLALRRAAGLSGLHVEGGLRRLLALSPSAADSWRIAPCDPCVLDTSSHPHD